LLALAISLASAFSWGISDFLGGLTREITRELSRHVGRERTRRFIEGVIAGAHVDLTAAEGWLLGRAEAGTIAADALKTRDPADGVILRQALGQLRTRGLVESSDPPARLTASGQEIRTSLMSARQRSLEYLVAGWQPEDHGSTR
jgi:hypothetical protein